MIELLLVWQVKNDNDAESDSVTACNNFCCLRDQLFRLESNCSVTNCSSSS